MREATILKKLMEIGNFKEVYEKAQLLDRIRYCPICGNAFNMKKGISAPLGCHHRDRIWFVEKNEGLKVMDNVTFEEWCKQLDAVVMSYHPDTPSYTKDTGEDCWRGYYDDGYTPEEAYREDCSNAW